jgi:hypothetical protein
MDLQALSPEELAAVETAKRLEGLWAGIHAHEAELAARWAPTLTPELVAELERKSQSDEDMSRDELEQWSVAVDLSQPELAAPEEEWDRWYETPVAALIAPAAPLGTAIAPSPLGTRSRSARPAARPRRRRRTNRGSPGRQSGDDDPHEPDLEALIRDAVEGAFARVLGGDR